MPEKTPPLLGLALANLLNAHGWKGTALAKAAGVAPSTVSAYLSGDVALTRERLDELAALMDLGPVQVEKAIVSARLLQPDPPPAASPVDPTPEEWHILDLAVAFGLGEITEQLQAFLLREVREAHARQAREEAEQAFERLKKYSRAERRLLIDGAPEFQTWALCVRLCDESEKKAAHCARQALEWANLACRVARHVPGTDAFRARLLAFARVFVANALRVKGHLRVADKVFASAKPLWEKGADEAGLLDEGRVLDLEASLRRGQRRFEEALRLHDEAFAAGHPDQKGVVLLNKAATLEATGNLNESIAVLEQASLQIDSNRQPRLLCVLRFNLANNLCRLNRAKEALPLVAEVRELAERLRNDLDLTRTLWLEAKAFGALGLRKEAVQALEQVRHDFRARSMPYDFGLASLDLALLYHELGHWVEVKELAAEMARVFHAAGVDRACLAAVTLFRDAAERQEVTEGLVRQVQEYLEGARSAAKTRPPGHKAGAQH